LCRTEHLDPGCGQLQGEGDAVKTTADAGNRGGIGGIKFEGGPGGSCALAEKRDRIAVVQLAYRRTGRGQG
jgi:hypothetical protein